MVFQIATAVRQAAGDAALALIDAGALAGHLKIYDGTVPTSVNDAIGVQVLLADLTMADPAFGATNASGVATASAITGDTSANATGTATFFRVEDSNGVARVQGSVATSGADLNLNSVAISAGVQVDVTSFTVTIPES